MNAGIRRCWNPALFAALLFATIPIVAANAAKPSAARKLDLTVPAPGTPGAARSPEDPRYATEVRSRSPEALLPFADRDGDFYRSQPIFQHEQRLQLLDAEVPLSLKLGKWKTNDDGKAMGLSATVPLRDPLQ